MFACIAHCADNVPTVEDVAESDEFIVANWPIYLEYVPVLLSLQSKAPSSLICAHTYGLKLSSVSYHTSPSDLPVAVGAVVCV